ncbi:MAG: helix-turn-helix transcriptional regulator [Burkholderiaceae bacterium]|nr:helix-turn-helix transcriptional regulator [Burkholderiaceae bacterium]
MAIGCCAAKETLFEAVLDAARWDDFLQTTSRCLKAHSAFIMSASPSPDHRPAWEFGLAHGTIRRYYEYFHHIDTWWARVSPPPPGQARLVRGEDLCARDALVDSEFFAAFLEPNRVRHMRALVVTPEAPRAAPFIVSWHRGPDQEPFDERTDETIRELGPVLLQAERMGTELLRARIDDEEGDPPAMFVLGATGRLLQTNAAGAGLIDRGVLTDTAGLLRPASTEAAAWLRTHLDSGTIASGFRPVLDAGAFAGGRSERRARPARCAGARCRLTVRLGPAGHEAEHMLEMRPLGRNRGVVSLAGASALLVVRPVQDADTAGLAARTAALFGWTPAEFDTVWRLYQNASTQEISRARNCSVETVRTHLKHAKRKAGVRRQVELVTLLMELEAAPA